MTKMVIQLISERVIKRKVHLSQKKKTNIIVFRIFLNLYNIQCPNIPEPPTDYTTFPEKHTSTYVVPAFKFITKPHTKPPAD